MGKRQRLGIKPGRPFLERATPQSIHKLLEGGFDYIEYINFILLVIISSIGCQQRSATPLPYRVALLGTLNNPLDPVLRNEVNSRTLLNQVCGRLVLIDENLALTPSLAKSWSISPDSLSYNFSLSEQYKFGDGSPVTADDVKFSMERMKSITDSYAASLMRNISEIKVSDPKTLQIKLATPNVRFLYLLAHPRFCILSQKQPLFNLDGVMVPNSFGDLEFQKWNEAQQNLTLRDRKTSQLFSVSYLNQENAIGAFNKGLIDDLSFYLLNDQEIDSITVGKKVLSTKYYWTWIFELNAKSVIGKNPKNRDLLLRNFDIKSFISEWGAAVTAGQAVIPKGVFGHQPEIRETLGLMGRAATFCKSPFSVGVIRGVPNEQQLAKAIKGTFRKAVGCEPKVNWYSMSAFTDEVAKAKDTMYFSAISNRMVDPIEYYRTFIKQHSENLLGCSHKSLEDAFFGLDQKPLHARSKEDYERLHNAFMKSACGIPIGYPTFKFVYSERIEHPTNNPIGMDLNFWSSNAVMGSDQ